MRRTFAKLTVLLLVLAMTLTGCNLIDVDQVAIVAEQRAELEQQFGAVVAEYNGTPITAYDIMAGFSSQYEMYSQFYAAYGMTLDQETVDYMVELSVNSAIQARLLAEEFDRRGMTLDKTAEEIEAEAMETYRLSYDYYKGLVTAETEELVDAYAELNTYYNGMTPESVVADATRNYKAMALQDALYAEVTDVTEEELQLAYEEAVAADEEAYTADPTMIETHATSSTETIAWMPEGYRTVKHILIIPGDEAMQAVTDARYACTQAEEELAALEQELADLTDDDPVEGAEVRSEVEIQADIDAVAAEIPVLKAAVTEAEEACLTSVQERIDEVYERLSAGEEFDAVMAELGEDPGMKNDPAMTTGYYVSAASTRWDPYFSAGAMALEAVGAYSGKPVISSSGIHIIYYNSDVPAGPVAFEEISDELYGNALQAKQEAHFSEVLTALLEEANIEYHLDAWTFS